MKNLIATLTFAIAGFSLMAQPISTTSDIQQVTVYAQGAKVFRQSKIRIPAGQQEVVIQGLSNQVQISSLQVRVPSNITLLTASFRTNFITPQKLSQEMQTIKDSIDALELEIQLTKNKQQAVQEEQELLLANKSVGGTQSGLDPEKVKQMAQYYSSHLPELKNRITYLSRSINKLDKRRTQFQNQLNELSRNINQPSGEITLQLDNAATQSVEIDFSYLIVSAGWTPAYDLRVEDIESPLDLTYKASVYQSSGIDWNKVHLVISTGNPAASQSRPVLSPWYLYYVDNKVVYEPTLERQPQQAESNVMYDMKAKGAGYYGPNVTVTENQLNVEFDIETPYTIASDNQQHLVVMKDYELSAQYQYHAVPKLDKNAFLLARVTDWNRLNLLPGPANIFFEHTYVGQNYLNPDIPTDTLLISLGRDQAIVVKREKQKEYSEKTFISGKVKETFVYEISVRNNKNREIDLEIVDHLPISQNEKITVEIVDMSGAQYSEKTGRLLWHVKLAPGGTQKYREEFVVKYPKDGYVRGL